jgi:hypothetical protein
MFFPFNEIGPFSHKKHLGRAECEMQHLLMRRAAPASIDASYGFGGELALVLM